MSLSFKKKESIIKIAVTVLGLVTAFAISGVLLLAFQINPLSTYEAIFYKAFGSTNGITQTLLTATPVMIAGIAVELSTRAGLFNIGAEGQVMAGAVGAQIAASFCGDFPPPIAIFITLAGGVLFGALWTVIPALLKINLGINEVVVFIMLNSIASYLLGWVVRVPLKDPSSTSNQAPLIPESAWLLQFTSGIKIHIGVPIAMILIFVFYWILKRTTFGFKMNVVGKSPKSAEYAGISQKKIMYCVFFISGGIAGLAGAIQLSGVHHRLTASASNGYGWTGLMVAALAGGNPVALILVALIYSALDVGSLIIQVTDRVPSQLADIIQAIIVLSVIIFQQLYQRFRKNKEAKV